MDKEKREKILNQILDQTDYQIILTELNKKKLEKQLAEMKGATKEETAKKRVEIDAMENGIKSSLQLREIIENEL